MPSPQHEALVDALKAAPITAAPSVAAQRAGYDATLGAYPLPADVHVETVQTGAAAASLITIHGATPSATRDPGPAAEPAIDILYLHGGGYVIGSHTGYREFGGRLARATGARVCVLDYRLAPEHPFPAAVDDAVAAVRWLRRERARPLVIAGDSAGGGLTFATLLALRDTHEPMPACAIGLSPWVDLACTGDTYLPGRVDDPIINPAAIAAMATMYAGERASALRQPLVSPLFGNLQGLPPLQILVGTREVLLDDSRRFRDKAMAAGVTVQYFEGEGLVHVWPVLAPTAPESDAALTQIAAFVHQHTRPA